MLSSNFSIRKAYDTLLSTITYNSVPVPVYWQQLPTPIAPGIYIIFGQIRNNDDSNKGASVTQTSVTVSVYTNSPQYNDGVAMEYVANEVLKKLYTNPQFNIVLAESSLFQVINTTLESDQTNDFSQDQQNIYIDRIMVFSHIIFQNEEETGGNFILTESGNNLITESGNNLILE